MIGTTLTGRYRVHSVLGRGGMGTVYQAQQIPLGRPVAVKVMSADQEDATFHQRFFQEAAILAKLKSPHTVTVFDYGRDAGVYFIAMELVSGESLDRVLAAEAPLPLPRALDIAQQICRSLREAHAQGIVHRDLKPANVILRRGEDNEELVKVLDFGLAKRVNKASDDTQRDTVPGSPKYMAPEVIRQEEIDGRADMYGLGVLLYQMLTGVVPFDRKGPMETLVAHLQDEPPSMRKANPAVEVPEAIERIVLRCLAKMPDERYAHMQELLDAIRSAAIDMGLGSNPSWSSPPASGSGRPSAGGTPAHGTGPLGREDTGAQALRLVDGDFEHGGRPPRLVEQSSNRLFGIAAAVVIGGAIVAYLTVGSGTDEGHADIATAPTDTLANGDALKDPATPPEPAPEPTAPEPAAPAEAHAPADAPSPAEPTPTPAAAEEQAAAAAPNPPPATPTPAAQQEPAAKPAPAAKPPPAPVTVSVSSTPPGAVVRQGGKKRGTTPTSFEASARQGDTLVLRVSMKGYSTKTVRKKVDGDSLDVSVMFDPNLRDTDLNALRALEARAAELSAEPARAPVLQIKPADGADEADAPGEAPPAPE